MRELIPDLMLLFDGYKKNYGSYSTKLEDAGGGKVKGVAQTLKGQVTVELWVSHLRGDTGLGVIPINEANRVRFAAIDIDEYPLDLQKLNAQIQNLKLPLVLCRTKSGGAHLYLFLEVWHDAGEVQVKMREMAALLGYGNAEIFPKQTKLVAERGDIGSWINMPYQNAPFTDRYALGAEGNKLNFVEFIEYARVKIISFKDLLRLKSANTELLPGGPPCLNHLVSMGFPAGTRNNGLFNICVYLKKLYGDIWPSYVAEYNEKYMSPPLDPSEVDGIIKSCSRKDFNYSCKQAPIANYCNMPRCRTCKHGIGVGDLGMPKFGSLTKLLTQPPIWFLEVEGGGRMELTTEDLQSPRNFQLKCMQVLNVMPICPKAPEWQEIVHKLLQEVNEVEVPVEATPVGQLWQHVEDFCTSRVQAKDNTELLLGKPWNYDGVIHFRLRDFLAYLERQKWRTLQHSNIAMHFGEWKFGKRFMNVRGVGVNVYTVPAKAFEVQKEAFDTPPVLNPENVL